MKKTYVVAAGVGLISLTAFFLARNDEFLRSLASIPMFGSLMAALFKVLHDEAAHERAMLVQAAQNAFKVGIESHMGKTAFDKYVVFSEAYVEEAQAALNTLLREGTSVKVLEHAGRLHALRGKHVLWLTSDVENKLDEFEKALRQIGAQSGFVESTRLQPQAGEQRQKTIGELYNLFARVMGFAEWEGQPLTDELTISALVRKLKTVLGTDELTDLRIKYLSDSSQSKS